VERWHDFYILTGTAAATLIGLMFVAVSFAIGSKAERSRGDVNAWVTPSLVYFIEVFIIAAGAVAPIPVRTIGWLLALLLLVNLPFGLWRLRYLFAQHREERIQHSAWFWQSLLPSSAQLILGLGALGILQDDARGLLAIPLSVLLLMTTAVRNAWSLVIFLLEQR
jgi:hypothetical protein